MSAGKLSDDCHRGFITLREDDENKGICIFIFKTSFNINVRPRRTIYRLHQWAISLRHRNIRKMSMKDVPTWTEGGRGEIFHFLNVPISCSNGNASAYKIHNLPLLLSFSINTYRYLSSPELTDCKWRGCTGLSSQALPKPAITEIFSAKLLALILSDDENCSRACLSWVTAVIIRGANK